MLQHLAVQLAAASVLIAAAPGALAQTPPPATPSTKILAIGTFCVGHGYAAGTAHSSCRDACDCRALSRRQDRPMVFAREAPGSCVHPQYHRHRCGTGHAGSATPRQGAPDDLRTRPDRAVEPAAPVTKIARTSLTEIRCARRESVVTGMYR